MKNIHLFKGLLIIQTIALIVYTVIAFKSEGANLFSIALFNVQSLNWNGQFNLDFSCYLTLSALWIMWRNEFSLNAIIVGVIALVFGIIFFSPYVLYLLKKENGNIKRLLIGNR